MKKFSIPHTIYRLPANTRKPKQFVTLWLPPCWLCAWYRKTSDSQHSWPRPFFPSTQTVTLRKRSRELTGHRRHQGNGMGCHQTKPSAQNTKKEETNYNSVSGAELAFVQATSLLHTFSVSVWCLKATLA